ncbi:hypothetical protein JHC09_04105 [Devosia sp. MC532]|uniref:hypothetical protein n=1 Tax=Devosia sp. MC532 TaxID=2799788 RepID=UPI0018F63023|nr:hypothetical protein [Devosia sp. MC532]MBJ7577067.1 hypothetical protein [Devosia sp. MC532]
MTSVFPITALDIRFSHEAWPLPQALRAAVGETWARKLQENPHLWDGRIIGVSVPEIDGNGVLRATAYEDAFSAFMTWRDQGFPEIGLRNLFGSALIISSDNAIILGVMGADTANAGRIYPPAGSLEPRDVLPNGSVDVRRSTEIELMEETGLSYADGVEGEMVAVFDGPRVSVARALYFPHTAEDMLATIRANLDMQEERELADVVAVRSKAELEAFGEPLPYVAALLWAFETGGFIRP